MPQAPSDLRQFQSLVSIVKDLRGPDGCPWDKEQTHQTLTRYAIEETAEFVDAVDRGDAGGMCEELGDVLLQVVLHAEIARQSGTFTIEDVIESIAKKMVTRHPHVFGGVKVKDAGEVKSNWHQLKAKEKQDKPLSGGLPEALPALIASHKIGERTKQHRFDWSKLEEVVQKVEEEIGELKAALSGGSKEQQTNELGDLLFSVAQLGRHLGVDSEQALRTTNKRFENRFVRMLELLKDAGKDPDACPLQELEEYWQKAKKDEGKK